MYVPDNYDAFVAYEREQERLERKYHDEELEENCDDEEGDY